MMPTLTASPARSNSVMIECNRLASWEGGFFLGGGGLFIAMLAPFEAGAQVLDQGLNALAPEWMPCGPNDRAAATAIEAINDPRLSNVNNVYMHANFQFLGWLR